MLLGTYALLGLGLLDLVRLALLVFRR